MHIYKELSFVGDKPAFDAFKNNAPSFATGDWKYSTSKRIPGIQQYAGLYADSSICKGFYRVYRADCQEQNIQSVERYNAQAGSQRKLPNCFQSHTRT